MARMVDVSSSPDPGLDYDPCSTSDGYLSRGEFRVVTMTMTILGDNVLVTSGSRL